MGSDSISNSFISDLSKDLGKKKRTNRLAKLKQSKFDVRREQWLSQVKNKGYKVDLIVRGGSPPSSLRMGDEGNRSIENLEMRPSEVDIESSSVHESDLESLISNPVGSSLGQNDSMKDLPGSSCSSASSGYCSGSVSEAEEEDDGCLDDWEAVADALTSDENQHNPKLEPPAGFKTKMGLADPDLPKNCGVNLVKTDSKEMDSRTQANCRAWRPDDAFRPQSLPNVSKQHSLTMNSRRLCSSGAITWGWQSIMSQPSCPICYEDLDLTDSSFHPCSCGFRLCLFCHKRILEADGRCPGCRKQYDPTNGDRGFNGGVTPFQMGRSFSMSRKS
uniref:RING-type domain-containing protein n=1 Tax=Davidia involucrata TaxID=16924 RepID=A0A5B7AH02_DAVIN